VVFLETNPQSNWQRSCANAVLDNKHEAIEDLQTAIEKSPHLRDEIDNEILFGNLKECEKFKKLNGNTKSAVSIS